MKSFPKIWALGSKQVPDILHGPVEVTEKMDGSQFGFGKTPEGELKMRSKGQWIDPLCPDKLFKKSVDHVLSIQALLIPDTFYYGEAITSQRHNTLKYDRVPNGHIVLFAAGDFEFVNVVNAHAELTMIANLMDIDVVPMLHKGGITSAEVLDLIKRPSYLGGTDMEGCVVKRYVPYEYMGQFVPIQCAKFVSEGFKEKHGQNMAFASGKSKMQLYFESFNTEARWRKTVEHLRDDGVLTHSPSDIGALLKELHYDLEAEYKQEIMEQLWEFYKKDMHRSITNGFPQWYKEKLLMSLSEDSLEVCPNGSESSNTNATCPTTT